MWCEDRKGNNETGRIKWNGNGKVRQRSKTGRAT